jgi:hypothetical protein
LDKAGDPIPETLFSKIDLKESNQWPKGQVVPMHFIARLHPIFSCQVSKSIKFWKMIADVPFGVMDQGLLKSPEFARKNKAIVGLKIVQ